MLVLNSVEAVYSDVILAVKGISMTLPKGGCVALLGANGAGKSTTLKAISNLIETEDGRVTAGSIRFNDQEIVNHAPTSVARGGLIHIMEGRRVLRHLTVEQNLIVGGHAAKGGGELQARLQDVYRRIPRLQDLKRRTAGYLSGGEQQLLVIGRAIMSRPGLIMIDEPSLGLAPLMVKEVFGVLRSLREEGVTLLIVEQNTRVALEIADYGYVMENGRIVMEGDAEQLMSNADIREFYLGLNREGGRRNYREVKHYRRRKRWLG